MNWMRQVALVVLVFFTWQVVASEVIPVDPTFAPPAWLQDVLLFLKSMPVVGPYLTEALKWLGVISAVLTTLTAALLSVIKVLTTVLTYAKLPEMAAKLEAFQNSKFIFWLKYFSMFNAQKAIKP